MLHQLTVKYIQPDDPQRQQRLNGYFLVTSLSAGSPSHLFFPSSELSHSF